MTNLTPTPSMFRDGRELSSPDVLEEGILRTTTSSSDMSLGEGPRLKKAQMAVMKYISVFKGNRVQRAAALVSQAVDGKGIPPELIGNPRFSHLVKAHCWLKRLKPFWNMVEIVLLLLNFLDVPAWCAGHCNLKMMREDYMAGSVPYISSVKVNTIQVICALCLSFKIYLQAIISRPTNTRIFKKYGVKMLAVFVLYLDSSLFFIGYMFPWIAGKAPNVDGSTIVRVLVVIVFHRDIRYSMVVLLKILPEFLNMGALVAIYIVFFAWMGRFIFHDSVEGPHAFSDIGNSLASMFTLILAINNPVVWTPAYKENPISCLFFITFLVIGVYLMMSLLFSVVFRGYRQRLADNLAKEVNNRRRCLDKAFRFLDLEDKGRITFEDLTKLLDVLHIYLELPHIQTDKIKFYFEVLDKDADHSIDQEEFHDFLTAIVMKFSKKYEPSWLEIQMECTNYYGQFLDVKSFVNGPYFEWMMIAVHIFNLAIIILETELDIRGSDYQVYVQFVQIALGEFCRPLQGLPTVTSVRLR
ncbi:Two pore calcium channel protein [Chara braunii]|uniref:Two pore calcium channel protein n=1 Tax=Chara braunii TaxID=69332 RepID=A0A388MC37_CHABU|nr:Two pore calcium channel protein [Chara braunii]|eukprot:GBG92126.1 Two pore calcium channel protein [Chara braunii]